MSKATLLLITSLLGITLVLLFIAIQTSLPHTTSPDQPESVASATPTPASSSDLSFSPNPILVQNSRGTVDIILNTGESEVSGVQLEIQYDPEVLGNVLVQKAGLFAQGISLDPLNRVNTKTGRVTFAISKASSQGDVRGKGTVATLSFTVLPTTTPSSSIITLLPTSVVAATTQNGPTGWKSILKSSESVTIQIPQQPLPTISN